MTTVMGITVQLRQEAATVITVLLADEFVLCTKIRNAH